jgi:hypothetical protein
METLAVDTKKLGKLNGNFETFHAGRVGKTHEYFQRKLNELSK